MLNLMISMQGQPISIRRPGWQFRFFVEPKEEVMQKLFEGLKEEGLEYLILHGNFGCGKLLLWNMYYSNDMPRICMIIFLEEFFEWNMAVIATIY
jgi:predicted ATPase